MTISAKDEKNFFSLISTNLPFLANSISYFLRAGGKQYKSNLVEKDETKSHAVQVFIGFGFNRLSKISVWFTVGLV